MKNQIITNNQLKKKMINLINSLKKKGHKIVFYTSRYMGRTKQNVKLVNKNYKLRTEKQLKKWGLKYDKSKLSLDPNNLKSIYSKIRSSIGFSLYWSTPIGPLQFNWAKPQQYETGIDKTENFSFNIASQF